METTTNIEIQTAEQNIEKLSKHKMEDAAIYALSNEHEIIRLSKRIAADIEVLVRDYTKMALTFAERGQSSLHNVHNNLQEIKAVLQVRVEARSFYTHLLK
jgi:hypothetical protein